MGSKDDIHQATGKEIYILEKAVKIQLISRYQLMQSGPPKEDTRIRYILTYIPSNPNMKEIAQNLFY